MQAVYRPALLPPPMHLTVMDDPRAHYQPHEVSGTAGGVDGRSAHDLTSRATDRPKPVL